MTVDGIRRDSPMLLPLERNGAIKITGAMYDLETGAVEFLA
jgi:carbonic anhydrase